MTDDRILTFTQVTKRPATDKDQFCVILEGGRHKTEREQILNALRERYSKDAESILKNIKIKVIMERE